MISKKMDKNYALNNPESDNEKYPEISLEIKLRELRIQKGFSLRALAELSGLNVNTLSLIENGKRKLNVDFIKKETDTEKAVPQYRISKRTWFK